MILKEIYAHKLSELAEKKAQQPLGSLEETISGLSPALDLEGTLKTHAERGESRRRGVKLIAEIKQASPSKGLLRSNFNPSEIALVYQENGASAISVLTDERFFKGRLSHIEEVRKAVKLPILRKDFIIDTYQIYETRARGADAVLLIAALLGREELEHLMGLAHGLGLSCLVEVHTEKELGKVLGTRATLIGINNRDLDTFKVDLETTLRLMPLITRDRTVVSESGINSRADVLRLQEAGVDAILVGEALMRSQDAGEKIRELLGL